MKFLIVGLKKNPQLARLVAEGEKLGHEVRGCLATELVIHAGENFEVELRDGTPLSDFDLIYLWAVGKRRWEWYTACLYVYENNNVKIVNKKSIDPNYKYFLSPAIDYMREIDSGIAFPKSVIIFSPKSLNQVEKTLNYPLIIKTSAGRQGKGVHLVNNRNEAEKLLLEMSKDESIPAIIAREFIPNDGDVRVFTVGFKAIGAMKRTPKVGDFRSNISQGGSGEVFDLDANPEIRILAEKESEVMQTEIAGVDVIINKETGKPYILEINPGPQFEGLEKYTGVNAAGEIIKYFESLVK